MDKWRQVRACGDGYKGKLGLGDQKGRMLPTQVQTTLRYRQHSGTDNTQVQTTLRYRQHSGTDNSQVQTTLKYT